MATQSTTEHPNLQIVRELLDAFAAADLDRFMDGFSDDTVFRCAGSNIISGAYRGKEAVRDYFIRLGQVTGGTMKIDVDEILAGDNHAVMFMHVTTERKGQRLEAEAAEAFRIDADGKVSESWFLYDDQVAYNAFYAEE